MPIAKSPVEAKGLGKRVANFKKSWKLVAVELMFKAMHEKFVQNRSLEEFLLKTRGTVLGEANPKDSFWGTGLSLGNPDIFNTDKWLGKNTAGKVLTRIRDSII